MHVRPQFSPVQYEPSKAIFGATYCFNVMFVVHNCGIHLIIPSPSIIIRGAFVNNCPGITKPLMVKIVCLKD